MKLTIGLSAALASFAAAAQQAAQVYILPTSSEFASSTTVSPSLARLILLQRLDTNGKGPSIHDVPDTTDPEEVVSLINKFGKEPLTLFTDASQSPSQLVVMLEGMSDAQMKDVDAALGTQSAFTIANPPSSAAHEKLVKNDFYNIGITNEHACSLSQVINPFEESCWSGKSTVAKYDVSEDSKVLKTLIDSVSKLVKLANAGEMETTLVLLPASRSSSPNQWSDKSQELRRREVEAIMSAEDSTEESAPTSAATSAPALFTSTGPVPSCFSSEDSCTTGTGNCSGHGTCVNKYANADGSEGKETCFTCQCLRSHTESGSVIYWAGPACSKQDISVQFWLFAGFTIVMVGILSLGIGMLFSVGEEKLPGVIGAGVSRSK